VTRKLARRSHLEKLTCCGKGKRGENDAGEFVHLDQGLLTSAQKTVSRDLALRAKRIA